MYSCSRTTSVALRTTRATGIHKTAANSSDVLASVSVCRNAAATSTVTSGGTVRRRSTIRMTTESVKPPRYPAAAPSAVPMIVPTTPTISTISISVCSPSSVRLK
jgi:hypothetical protein